MAKNYSNKNRKRKAVIAMLCALSVTCTGLAAACAPTEENPPSTAVTAKDDAQLLKNGNFEHFDIPDKAIHLIKNVNSWTLGGDTSVKSGIVGTSDDDWGKLTADDLAEKLDFNNDLTTDNDEYVNYNSMRSRDIPYKDTYAATLEADKLDDSWITKYDGGYQGYFDIQGDEESGYTLNGETVYYNADDKEFYFDESFTNLVRKELIANPGTHWGDFKTNDDGTYAFGDQKAYKDDNGNYYLDEDMEEKPVGNVLMIHNAPTDSNNNGLHQYYTSSSITLEAQTSAEISLWVKTSDLKFNKGYAADENEEDKGAYIEVVQTVASSPIDSFQIKAINTEKILGGTTDTELKSNNGWVKYTVYINACDFANTTVQLKLGLGNSENNEKVTGYAFFDDVQVTKYRELSNIESYDKAKVANTTCTLTSDEDEKIFYADVASDGTSRHAYDFNYLIDLASETGMGEDAHYAAIPFDTSSVQAGLTTEKDSKGAEYAAAKEISNNVISNVGSKAQSGLNLPKDLTDGRPTSNDLITAFDKNKVFSGSDFSGRRDFSKLLNNLTGDNGAHNLPAANGGNTLVMFSAYGAPYTSTITHSDFTLAKDGYLLVSFWVKTSDMDGDTAATAKVYELDKNNLPDEDSVQTLTVDTTDKTTDFEDEKDIYKGWVQCFVFVKNETDSEKTFKIDFSFGTTEITSATSFESGYAAIANLQTLNINEDIYDLASAGTTTALFSFTKDSKKDGGTAFDEATGTYDVNEGLALPDTYTGINGANVLGSLGDKNSLNAGLINRDVFGDENSVMTADAKKAILNSFLSGATEWDKVFGENCYQPLIIINNLRTYVAKAAANETNFEKYYILLDDDSTETADVTLNGKKYKSAKGTTYSDDETYYSLTDVVNYGYYGASKTVAANGREVISVRVKVSGDAVAYVYLVDTSNADDLKLLNYTTPSYTFWYDEEGNVLDEELDEDWTASEHREHIVYTLRDDGLYDGEDGKLYGNLYNLVKSYKDSKYEHVEYFNEDGTPVIGGYDYIEKYGDGKTFYKTSAGKNGTVSDHYLCSTDGTHVYECIDGKYYYVEITEGDDDKTTEVTNRDNEINNFDIKHARYSNPEINKELAVKLTKDDCDSLGDENGWVTVNFVVSAGSDEKNYRLEVWSGARNETGVDADGKYADGAVAFDYSHGTVSETRLSSYETEIINAYNRAIAEVKPELLGELTSGTKENIRSYEKLLENLTADQKQQIESKLAQYTDGKYEASYYTFTLYDSEAYVPFNANTARDGETGYNYDASSFTEKLAYLKFDDESRHEKNIFVDYSAVDQSISKNTVSDSNDTEEEENNNSAELGLYISSIVLVVVLLITLVSILITQYIKKRRKAKGVKNSNKNVYRKRDRYVKKLHLVKDEVVEPETEGTTDVPEAEIPAEEPTPVDNEATEVPAEEPAPEETTEETSDENKE